MKTLFLKRIVPYAVVLTVGTAGAFVTTSMQKTADKATPRLGYVTDENNVPCNKPISCDTQFSEDICRVSYDVGEQAKGKANNCQEILYRPDDN